MSALEQTTGLARDPVSGDIARNQESKRGTKRRAGEIPDASPERSEQSAAGQGEDHAGNEGDGPEGIQDHIGNGRP